MNRLCALMTGLVLFFVGPGLGAQELSPRIHWPAPKGVQVIAVGLVHTSGDTVPDPSLPVTGVDSNINTLVLNYRRTIDLWGRTANFVVEAPYSRGETRVPLIDGDRLKREYQGAGDLSATLSVNFLGAPTMNQQEFGQLRLNPRPIIGGSIKVVAPTGKYDENRVVNVGSNRWAAKADLGYITPIGSHRWLLEFNLGAWVFGDNDDFIGTRRKQDPIGSLEVHLVRRLAAGFWISLDGNYYTGGRSEVGRNRLDDVKRDSKVGMTFVYPFAKGHAIRVGYAHGSLSDSDESFDSINVFYQKVF